MKKILTCATLVASLQASAVLGPIPIFLNTEYRTTAPVIDSIASSEVFSAQDIKNSGAGTLLEFLSINSGLNVVNQQGNIPAIFMRGNEARHTLVLLDGAKISDVSSTDGAAGYGLSNIALNDIEKIEIIKNGSSVLYGAGAIAGVIAITTKKGATDSASISLETGTHNSKKYTFSGSSGDANNYIRFAGSKYLTDGISARSDNKEKDARMSKSAHLKMGVAVGNTNIGISLLRNDSTTEYDNCFGSDDCLSLKNLYKKSISLDTEFTDYWNVQLQFDSTTQARDDNGFKPKYLIKKLSLLNTFVGGKSSLNVGIDKHYSQTESNFSTSASMSSDDVFLQYQHKLEYFDMNIGTRFIKHSDFGNENVYSLGFAKSVNDYKFTLSHGRNFSAPSIFQINFEQTQNLQAETSQNLEFGVEKTHSWGTTGLRLYKNDIQDLITYVDPNNDSQAPTFTTSDDYYYNEDELNIKGIELSLQSEFAGYIMRANYSYNDSKLAGQNTQQIRRAKNIVSVDIGKKYDNLNYNIGMVYKSSTLDDTDGDSLGDTKFGGYTLTNAFLGYILDEKTTIHLNASNVFNKDYAVVEGYNSGGRRVHLGLTHNF